MALVKKENGAVDIDPKEMAEWRSKIHKNGDEFLDFCKKTHRVPDIHNIIPWSHWITPQKEKIRFDTKFYLTVLNDENEFHSHSHDGQELVNSRWYSPNEVIEAFTKEELLLPPPTWFLLRELSEITEHENLASQKRDLSPIEPTMIIHGKSEVEGGMGNMILALPGDSLHHASKDKTESGYQRILVTTPFTYTFQSSPLSKL
jgi:hypothetical protein